MISAISAFQVTAFQKVTPRTSCLAYRNLPNFPSRGFCGGQPRLGIYKIQCFRDQLHVHHQGDEIRLPQQ